MRELVSGVLAVLLPLGVLAGLEHSIHTARFDVGAPPRPMRLESASVVHDPTIVTTGLGLADDTLLGAPRPAVVLRLLTLDISNPQQPVPVALRLPPGRTTWQPGAIDDPVAALWAYAQEANGSSPEAGREALMDHDFGVAVSDHYAYVATGAAGLRIFDYTAQASERREALFPTPGEAEAVLVRGDRAHVAVVQQIPAYSGYD